MAGHVLVIGGGVIGLSVAYYTARSGARVTIVERDPAAHEGCSHGNAGMIVPSHIVPLAAPGVVGASLRWMLDRESPFHVRLRPSPDLLRWGLRFLRSATMGHVRRASPVLRDLSLASRAEFEGLAGELDDFGLLKSGIVMLCRTGKGLAEESEVAKRARALGIPAEPLSPSGVTALDPDIRLDVAGGVYYPQDCHLTPERFIAALRRKLSELGVAVHFERAVAGWRVASRSDGRSRIDAVRTASGELVADRYVVCGGSWSSGILRELGIRLPLQAGKGYSLTLVDPPRRPRVPAILVEARVAVTPMDGALRVGGTMEIGGLDTRVDPVRVRGIVRSVARYYPDLTEDLFRGVRPWCGLRPCSPDGLPYVGAVPGIENLVVATGHAMMGLSLAPITGKLVADILGGREPSPAIDALRPDRFA